MDSIMADEPERKRYMLRNTNERRSEDEAAMQAMGANDAAMSGAVVEAEAGAAVDRLQAGSAAAAGSVDDAMMEVLMA